MNWRGLSQLASSRASLTGATCIRRLRSSSPDELVLGLGVTDRPDPVALRIYVAAAEREHLPPSPALIGLIVKLDAQCTFVLRKDFEIWMHIPQHGMDALVD